MRIYLLLGLILLMFTEAHCQSVKHVLFVGLERGDFFAEDIALLKNYHIIERPSMPLKDANNFRKLINSEYTFVLSPDNKIYAYDQKGELFDIWNRDIKQYKPDYHFDYEPVNGKSLEEFSLAIRIDSHKNVFPGGYIPDNAFPGTAQYSYLFGEGKNPNRQPYSNGRKIINEIAGIHQNNNLNPFWNENYLRANRSPEDTADIARATNFSNSSNPLRDIISIGSQWGSYAIGTGATIGDSYLDYRDLQRAKHIERRYSRGLSMHSYPYQYK